MSTGVSLKYYDIPVAYRLTNYINEGLSGVVITGELRPGFKEDQNNSIVFENKVAVKFYKNELAQNTESDFINEIEIMSQLNHRGVLSLQCYMVSLQKKEENHPHFQEFNEWRATEYTDKKYGSRRRVPNRSPIIVTKFMEKGTIQKAINNHFDSYHRDSDTATTLSKIIYGVADAMAYLHSNNIVHGDLKVENIFLNEHSEPVVADFGFSMISEESEISTLSQDMSELRGTLLYKCPESGTFAGDIYSFGVLLVVCFVADIHTLKTTDDTLVSGNNLATKIMQGQRFLKPELMPEKLYQLAQQCWTREPFERPYMVDVLEQLKQKELWVETTKPEEMLAFIEDPLLKLRTWTYNVPDIQLVSVPPASTQIVPYEIIVNST